MQGHNYIRWGAGASLLLLMIGLAVFNVQQWIAEGFYILAVVALCAELIGFVMAVMTEIAIRSKRYTASAVCGLILVVCAGFNVIGAERAWDASMVRHLDSQRREAQRTLDAARGELRQKLADANTRISAYDYLLPGAETMRARQAGMQAAWERATLQARQDASEAQAELDRQPVTAEVVAPFAAWQVRLGFWMAELCKALGLWAIGAGASFIAAETQRSRNTEQETPETPPETTGETNVVSLATMRERARELRNANPEQPMPYSRIAREIGCSKKHAWVLVNT